MVKDQSYIVRAEAARCRGRIYELLLRVFARLPDNTLIQEITSQSFHDFLDTGCGIGSLRLREAITNIKLYCSAMESRTQEEILNDLAVDRTRLLRATGDRNLKPPYESLYKSIGSRNDTAAAVKSFYRRTGLLPDENISEMLDYMCVELDFMYQLCLREVEEWSSGRDATTTLIHEDEFLREHLGSWLGDFCAQAEKYARTAFYRGFLVVLDVFIGIEMEYLQSLMMPTAE